MKLDDTRFKRWFNDEHSEDDKEYVIKAFCDDTLGQETEHALRNQWYESLQEDKVEGKDLEHILHRIHYNINLESVEIKSRWSFTNIMKWSARIAAILAFPIIIGLGYNQYMIQEKNDKSWVEIKTSDWTRSQFHLPDGTTGWLNNSSSLRYNNNFNKKRRVILTGEAFFDVHSDKKRPFIVTSNEVIIEVSGTRFNIASYENEDDIEVVLEEGEIVFSAKGSHEKYTMHPEELIVYKKSLNCFTVKGIQSQKYVSWKEGKQVFRDDPIDEIAKRLERWFNIDVEVNDIFTDDLRLRATFLDESLEEVLYYLKKSLPIECRIEDGELGEDECYQKKKVIITKNRNNTL